MGVTRITHQAAIRMGLTQSVTEAYQVRLKLSGEPRFVLRAEGVETLECVRSRNERRGAKVLQPDVIIGWSDWNKDQRGHLHEGDVRHHQRAVSHPALSRCKAGTEGERRTDVDRPSG